MKRYKALDIFRGITICLMIIVNSAGDWDNTFAPLLHAKWHGFTITDLVFPSFLFAVGNALAFASRSWENKSFSQVWGKITKRTLLIFLLGFIMYWFPFFSWNDAGGLDLVSISNTRIFGVLQRIAICYFFASLMIYYLSQRKLIIASVILLVLYWIVLVTFGDLSLADNLVRRLDLWMIGGNHMHTMNGIPFDPEGLLSTVPAIVNVIAGYLVGKFIIQGKMNIEKLFRISAFGIALCTLVYFWDFVLPVNKRIWTSSFTVLTVGLDMVLLTILIYAIDFVKNPKEFNFFNVFGKNPLFIYLFSEYLVITLGFIRVGSGQTLYSFVFDNGFAWIGPYYGSFVFALTIMMICWLLGWVMDKKKIYIKV